MHSNAAEEEKQSKHQSPLPHFTTGAAADRVAIAQEASQFIRAVKEHRLAQFCAKKATDLVAEAVGDICRLVAKESLAELRHQVAKQRLRVWHKSVNRPKERTPSPDTRRRNSVAS